MRTIEIPEELEESIRREAGEFGLSMSDYLHYKVRGYVVRDGIPFIPGRTGAKPLTTVDSKLDDLLADLDSHTRSSGSK